MSDTDAQLDRHAEFEQTVVGRFRGALSDEDRGLIARRFWISDPEALPNLLDRVPARDEVPEIEYRYDVTPPKGKSRPYVRCAHCFRPIHWKGNVARYADGCRLLLGCDCGEKQFGFRWSGREEHFSDRMSRHDLLMRLEGLETALPLLHSFLVMLSEHPGLDGLISLRDELHTKMPELASLLTRVLHASGGELEITEHIRDVAAEIARDDRQKYAKNPETKPIFISVTKSLGRIAGASFVLEGASPLIDARNLVNACTHLQRRLALVTSRHVLDASPLLEEGEGVVRAADGILNRLEAANKFFGLSNLQTIIQWLRKRMKLTAYTASQAALARLGEVETVRIERRLIAVPEWSSRKRIGDLLGVR